mgnify:CR=1 FL=1
MLKYLPILDRLIGFPTVSSRTNLDCIDYIEGFLSDHGFSAGPDPAAGGHHDDAPPGILVLNGPELTGSFDEHERLMLDLADGIAAAPAPDAAGSQWPWSA